MDPTSTKELTTTGEECLRRNKLLTSERGLLSDDYINAIRLLKYDIRVTGSGHAHKMPITPSLMQTQRSAYAVHTKRIEEEKVREDQEMHHKAKAAKENQHTQNILKQLESRKGSLSEVQKCITKEQATQEEMRTAERLFREVSQRLQDAIKTKDMVEMTVFTWTLGCCEPKNGVCKKESRGMWKEERGC